MKPLAKVIRFVATPALIVAMSLSPKGAGATVHREGAWPASEKKVSFEFDGKPSDGLKKLADEAGWSLVMSKGIAAGETGVHIAVEDQPADAVLEALFIEGNVVARRSGTLITITSGEGYTPPANAPVASASASTPATPAAAPDVPAPPPVPTVRGEDRNVLGASVTIGKDEVVHTLTVTGGSAKVLGVVTGDLVVAGGSVKIEEGGRVVGNASVMGGSIKLEKGARIDGDVGVVGGAIKREDGSFVGGAVVDKGHGKRGNVNVKLHDGKVSTHVEGEPEPEPERLRSRVSRAAHEFGSSMTKMALLFVLGCVFLALATRRMESLRIEAAARPMKSFALGILGSLGALFVVAGVSLTIVGIPFVVLGVLFALLATYVAIAAVLTTFGAAVLGHKTQSPYLHLLFGCVVFLVLGALPYIGGFVTLVVVMIAIGSLVSTRLGGLVVSSRPKPDLV